MKPAACMRNNYLAYMQLSKSMTMLLTKKQSNLILPVSMLLIIFPEVGLQRIFKEFDQHIST